MLFYIFTSYNASLPTLSHTSYIVKIIGAQTQKLVTCRLNDVGRVVGRDEINNIMVNLLAGRPRCYNAVMQ